MSEGHYVFIIGYQPRDDRSNLEALEMILAAAALEIDIAVVFTIEASAWLNEQGGARWRQLVDFDLAKLHQLRLESTHEVVIPIATITPNEFAELREPADRVIVL
ncbi:MAG: DsrE family protein [Pseudomonadota bacterium]